MSKDTVKQVTNRILYQLNGQLELPSGRSKLANIRNTIGKPLNQAMEIWPMMFQEIPEEFLGRSGEGSFEEKAILAVVQLYALHQQGNSTSVLATSENRFENIGTALRTLRGNEDSTAIDRRFNTMLTSSTFEELIHHLRHLVKILKAKSKETKVDYGNLTNDLYWFLREKQGDVRLRWAREYYRQTKKEEKGELQDEK